MTDEMEFEDMDIQLVARICHEANKAYCEGMHDFTQKPWDETDPELQASAINGVRNLLENPDATAISSHANWLKFKTERGWTYGETKDVEAKTHPCMVPYHELPRDQQVKDHLFHAIVRAVEIGVMKG